MLSTAGRTIGTFAVQLAKHFGSDVTCVDSTEKLDMLGSIGADHIIDYTQEDFTKSSQNYDVIFEMIGKSSFSPNIRSLKQNGLYLLSNAGQSQMVRGLWTSRISSKKVIFGAASKTTDELVFLRLRQERSNRLSINAICWNRLPKRTDMSKQDTTSEM